MTRQIRNSLVLSLLAIVCALVALASFALALDLWLVRAGGKFPPPAANALLWTALILWVIGCALAGVGAYVAPRDHDSKALLIANVSAFLVLIVCPVCCCASPW